MLLGQDASPFLLMFKRQMNTKFNLKIPPVIHHHTKRPFLEITHFNFSLLLSSLPFVSYHIPNLLIKLLVILSCKASVAISIASYHLSSISLSYLYRALVVENQIYSKPCPKTIRSLDFSQPRLLSTSPLLTTFLKSKQAQFYLEPPMMRITLLTVTFNQF